MSRVYNIRWREQDNDELRRVVKNFNAKITRLQKKFPDKKNSLPEKVSVKELKKIIRTRNDLKRELKSLEKFTNRGSEQFVKVPGSDYNLEITKWQRNEMQKRAKRINKIRAEKLKEYENLEAMDRGQKLGYTKGQMGLDKVQKQALNPINDFTPRMDYKDIHKKAKTLRKENKELFWTDQDIRMKENYIKGLKQNYNKNDIADVIEAIEEMDYKDFRLTFESSVGRFEETYPGKDKENYGAMVEGLKSTWIKN